MDKLAKKKYQIQIAMFAIAIGICVVLFIIFGLMWQPSKYKESKQVVNNFNKENLIWINTDTLQLLLNKNYQSNCNIQRNSNKLNIIISNVGSKVADFYNDNPNLLTIHNMGFEIEHNKENNEIKASFENKHVEGVLYTYIPSDVLYRLVVK